MKRLIVNADDLGLSTATNAGIFDAHANGIVTAATCLVTLEGFDDAVERAASHPRLDLGVHVNLTWGRPASPDPLPRLAPGGRFRGKRGLALALALGRVPADEIRREIVAQLETFKNRLGTPSHVDVHQHFHAFERVWDAIVDVTRDADVPWLRFPAEPAEGGPAIKWIARRFARRPRPDRPPRTTDHFRGLAWPGRLDADVLDRLIGSVPDGLTELMVHPGAPEPAGAHPDRLSDSRTTERVLLTSDRVRKSLEEAGIRLTTFSAEAAGSD